MKRNYSIIAKAFKHFFVASILISLVEQVNALTDSAIVSHFISEDALSAIGLTGPIKQVVYAVLNLLLVGASTLAAVKIGERKYKTANRYFTVSVTSVVAIITIVYMLMLPKMESLCRLLTDEERLLPYLCQYLPIAMINCIISAASSVLMTFTKIDGMPRLVTACVIIEGIANVIFDCILIGLMGMGIAGAAWATILSVMVATAYLTVRVKRRHSILHLEFNEIKNWYFTLFKDILPVGVPIFVGTLSMAALRFFLNNAILDTEGADGMFVMTVFMQLMIICNIFSTGAGGAICSIGGMLLGEKDNDGFRALLRRCLTWATGFTLLLSAVLMIWPEFWANVFGASAGMQAYSSQPLRIMFMTFLPMCITEIMSGVYNLQKYHKFVTTIMLAQLMLPLLLAVAAKYFAPHLIWYAFPAGSWLRLLLVVIISSFISHKDKLLNPISLVPVFPENPGVDVCSNYNAGSLAKALDTVREFMSICVISKEFRNRVILCIEDISNNILFRSQNINHKVDDVFTIRVIDENENITVIFKEEGRPFNPVMKFEPLHEAKYNYMNGINYVYLTFQQ